jgi:segregation and condensation protein A
LESVLTNACRIKIDNFEGPFDLLFHLIEKNQFNIYDIPINIITDQYMEYLFSMRELDMEIASEFLVMAATLLHIKSRMLLPSKNEKEQEEIDPREELVMRLLEYRKFKDFANNLKQREYEWAKIFYKLPESIGITARDEILELSQEELRRIYSELLEKNRRKMNPNANINRVIQLEKISLRSKMREIIKELMKKNRLKFSELFSFGVKSTADIVMGFMAALELAKMRKVKLNQRKMFGEIYLDKMDPVTETLGFEQEKLDNMA